ncbi:unnamed protein product [Acanthoscelides obtectus]|uniref:Endonuclease/exonuclease/phosphatase domain-containing protein n=1 Tax=Acanthoscelides obtectus TaxID=200917 RepID=A0A9P0QI05_ACAOB|nr:unnamed protein product [Acanthoscelides obtectus]CAK1683990.1 hypothetical protein AOBTE_LOCUS34569 [Acanthoscelides obtectus]
MKKNGGVVAFVRSSLSYSRDDILWLRLYSKTSPKFICCLYRSPSDHNWDGLLEYLAVVLLGDFNAHNELWLGSNKTDAAGRALVTSPTFFPRISTAVLSPLGNSDHCVVEVRFRSEPADGLRDFSSFPRRDVCFTDANASAVCFSITEIIHVGMEEYILHTVKVPKPRSNILRLS